MNAKQTISDYIAPSRTAKTMLWVFFGLFAALAATGVILTVIIGEDWMGAITALSVIPLGLWLIVASPYFGAKKKAKRCLKRLEELGQLENAAAELNAEGAVIVGKDSSRLTEHFAFRRHGGVVVSFDDVRWVFIYPGTNSRLEITTNLMNGTSFDPVSLPNKKGNFDQLRNAYGCITDRCSNAMVDYNEQNLTKYREILTYLKAEAKAARK